MSTNGDNGERSFTVVNHVSRIFRNISLVSAQLLPDTSDCCSGDWIYIDCISDPSFGVVPLEPYSTEFLDVERLGLEFIRKNFKDIEGSYFLSSLSPLNPEKNTLLFERLSDPDSAQFIQKLKFESFKNLPGAQIEVLFRLVGFDGKNYESIRKYSELWKFIETRVLEYLYCAGETAAWSYELNSVFPNFLYLSARKSS